MATIKQFKLAPSSFPGHLTSRTGHITHTLNISPEVLEYKLVREKTVDEQQDTVLHNFRIDLSTINNHNRFCDHSLWMFKATLNPVNGEQENAIGSRLVSVFENTFLTKQKPLVQHDGDPDFLQTLRIFVPSVNSTFEDCTFFVLNPADATPDSPVTDPWNITVSVDVNSPHVYTAEVTNVANVMGEISATTTVPTVSPGDVIPVTVTCSDPTVTTLYLDQVVGVLDRTQIAMTSGTGKFNVLTNTLQSGDTVKVKIGYKKFTNVNTFTKAIA